jgi:glutamate N-acetyltransferase/amino-acid N-acetyltransferase
MGSVPLRSPLDPSHVSVSFVPSDGSAPLAVLVNGEPEKVDETRAKQILSKEDFEVLIDMGVQPGGESAKYWTCDFSYVSGTQASVSRSHLTLFLQEYVRINGDYRS